MSFEKYAAAGFETELLPILPPDAAISPRSPQAQNLLANRGKVPGKIASDGWFGFAGWSTYSTAKQDITRWSRSGAGIGLQGRKYPAIDIDVDQGGLADAIENEALLTIGLAPCRFGRGARRLLVYSGAGIKKRRLAFRRRGRAADPAGGLPGGPDGQGDPGRDDLLAEAGAEAFPIQAVEILGDGQQYVAEGIHPKTGKPYNWRDGRCPADVGGAELVLVTAEEIDAFLERVEELVLAEGYEIVSSAGRGLVSGAGRSGTWQNGLTAPSLEAVRAALAAIDNDLDYDDWLRLMAAVKASTEGLTV